MRVARVEAVGDAPASLVEHDVLPPDRPVAREGPLVEAQALGELDSVLASPNADAAR